MTFPKGSLGAAASYYASLGWPVFPLAPGEKLPLFSRKDGGHGVKDATTDLEQITAWWTSHPTANIGIATGGDAGLYVVDIDGPEGEASLARYGDLPATPESRTGKGRHILFRWADGRNTASKLGPKLDTRGAGGYIVAPPSIHPNGGKYRWHVGPHEAPVAELPAFFVETLTSVAGSISPPDGTRTSAIEVVLQGVAEGGRNQALTEYVGRLFAKGLRELEVLELARGVNVMKLKPPLDNAEVEAVVNSVASAHLRNHGRGAGGVVVPLDGTPMVSVGMSVFEDMLTRAQQPVDAMATMWPSWNRCCRMYGGGVGLARGWHIVVGGGAGAGKSLVALNLTASVLRDGHKVGWVSLEMRREQLLLRMLGIMTGRSLRSLEPGEGFAPDAFAAASYEVLERMKVSGSGLWMAERPSRELPEVDRLMRDAVEAGCRLIVVDYLQLVSVPDVSKLDDAMRRVSAAVQSLAYRHNVTTLALSQFNRSTTADREVTPSIHGFQGGSAIENDADQALLLDHTSRKDTPTGKSFNVMLDKNRHGPGSVFAVNMDHRTLQLTEPPAMVREGPPQWYDQGGA
jgi:KaiC/GvpD/RAD55 family RecA-like ATPase